ncbi:uncharacterized protein LY89DRAFT_210669 [Mollisia scopiformis]|uniref:Uncharacterized protein n=1 Tax=Mollisia scopiformis TaxID=149040 RepID=A0A194WXD3_MOLSC|nr:uncharacterized protein LY89DRAFT_210669 [Mollisia scopiformis]KUJ12590.1 hypothetical protein LY89DRAFT_210669 [Mollisia scopiformis]
MHGVFILKGDSENKKREGVSNRELVIGVRKSGQVVVSGLTILDFLHFLFNALLFIAVYTPVSNSITTTSPNLLIRYSTSLPHQSPIRIPRHKIRFPSCVPKYCTGMHASLLLHNLASTRFNSPLVSNPTNPRTKKKGPISSHVPLKNLHLADQAPDKKTPQKAYHTAPSPIIINLLQRGACARQTHRRPRGSRYSPLNKSHARTSFFAARMRAAD